MNIENQFKMKICEICYEREKCSNFKCNTCNSSVCVECFAQISGNGIDEQTYETVYDYKCPICRDYINYTFDIFTKDEIINLDKYNNNLIFNKYIKKNRDIIKNTFIESITKEYEYEIKILQDANIQNLQELKEIKYNIKFLYDNTKTKRIDKQLLKSFF